MTAHPVATQSGSAPKRLAHWSADESIGLVDGTAATLLRDCAHRCPDQLAIIGMDCTGRPWRLTYRELWDQVRAVADVVLGLSREGDCIAILAHNVIEWPIVQYAVALTGRVLVALNPLAGLDELRYTLDRSGATVLLYAPRIRAREMAATVTDVVASCPSVRSFYDLGWLWSELRPVIEDDRWPQVDAVKPAMLQYTSGTTGRQKGVLLAHRSMVNVARIVMETVGVPAGSMSFSPFPQFHTAGCVTSTLGALAVQGTVIIADRWKADDALETIARERVTLALLVPTMLDELVQVAASTTESRRLPTILVGGARVAPVTIEAARRVFGGDVLNVYGQTELCAPVTSTLRCDSEADVANTIGRPLPQVEVRIADPDSGRTLAVGQSGEICARGYQQMLEYHRDPEATASAVDREGWLHTGDLATMDARGYIRVDGRLKEMIHRGGENISPAEIAECLLTHTLVQQATVVGLPDARLGETVAAVLVISARVEQNLAIDELTRHCADRLAPYKIPQHWFFTNSLPLTAAGKVRTLAVRQQIIDGQLSPWKRDRLHS